LLLAARELRGESGPAGARVPRAPGPPRATCRREISTTRATFSARQARDQVIELEHEADVPAAVVGEDGIAGGGEVEVPKSTVPLVGTSRPPRMLSNVDLPLPKARAAP